MLFAFFCASSFNCVQEKSKDQIVNIIDPDSKVYIPPHTTILEAPQNILVTSSSVTLRWTGTKDIGAYAYRLDDTSWISVGKDSVLTIADLDDTTHTLAIRSTHINGNVETNYPVINFRVDAVKGQSLMFLKRRREVKNNEVFEYYVKAEEVAGVMGSHLIINYPKSKIQVLSVEAGSFTQESGRTVNPNPILNTIDNTNGRVSVDMLINGGVPRKGLWGSGVMVKLVAKALAVGTADITFQADSVSVRDTSNVKIILTQLVNGKIVIR